MPRLKADRPEPSPTAIAYVFRDASRISGLSPSTLRRHAKEERLKLVRVGNRTLVNGDSLRALLAPAAE